MKFSRTQTSNHLPPRFPHHDFRAGGFLKGDGKLLPASFCELSRNLPQCFNGFSIVVRELNDFINLL